MTLSAEDKEHAWQAYKEVHEVPLRKRNLTEETIQRLLSLTRMTFFHGLDVGYELGLHEDKPLW